MALYYISSFVDHRKENGAWTCTNLLPCFNSKHKPTGSNQNNCSVIMPLISHYKPVSVSWVHASRFVIKYIPRCDPEHSSAVQMQWQTTVPKHGLCLHEQWFELLACLLLDSVDTTLNYSNMPLPVEAEYGDTDVTMLKDMACPLMQPLEHNKLHS